MKKIAIVTNTSWNIFNFRLALAQALQDDGFCVVAVAPKDEYSHKLQELGIEHYHIDINNKGTNPLEDLKLIWDFYHLYKKLKPDIVLHYTIKPNIYGSIALKFLGIPTVNNISGLGTVFLNNSLSSRVAKWLYGVALKGSKKVFFQNSHDRDLFVELKLASKQQSDLLPGSGIDTERFKPSDDSSSVTQEIKFLFVARLVRDKGLIEYVQTAKSFIDNDRVQFYILGSYYMANPTAITEDQMQDWEASGAIVYLGSTDDVCSVMQQYDCVVLPSYREGLSRVLLEAASLAKPIITTDTPGCREVVDDGVNGYLCKVKDSKSLTLQVEKMVSLSAAQRKEMGRLGREKVVVEFDQQIVIDRYREAITQNS